MSNSALNIDRQEVANGLEAVIFFAQNALNQLRDDEVPSEMAREAAAIDLRNIQNYTLSVALRLHKM